MQVYNRIFTKETITFPSAKTPHLHWKKKDSWEGREFLDFSLLLTHLFYIISLITQECLQVLCIYKGYSTDE